MNNGTHSYSEDIRNKNIVIFINGKFFNRNEAFISVFDSGFLLGDGVWEGIRLFQNKLLFLEEHIDRLYSGANKLSININLNKYELINLIKKTLNKNNMKTGVHIRIIISRGLKKTPYQHPNVNIGECSIVIIPEYKEANKQINKKGIHIKSVKIRRGTPNDVDPTINSLSKQNCIAACIEAHNAGADEGLMLDINGNVSTCNSTNFFIIKNTEIWTSSGKYCLPGITRQTIINLCKKNNLTIYKKNFFLIDTYSANEAFVTGTFAGIIPVRTIDNHQIGNGKIGAITKKLQELYCQEICNY